MSQNKLDLEDVRIVLGSKIILDNINLSIKDGEIVSLMGASASGKTSLVRSIAGFNNISSGRIKIDGQIIDDSNKQIDVSERNIGFIFQDLALFPHLTVRENICFGLNNIDSTKKLKRAEKLEALLNIKDIKDRYPNQISGGQQQRVAIARAIAPQPKLLILDEPFSALDYDLKLNLMEDIIQLIKSENITAILITHSAQEAFKMSDKIAFISNNTITQYTSPYDIYHRPSSKEISNFFGISSYINAEIIDSNSIRTTLGNFNGNFEKYKKGDQVALLIRPDNITYDDESEFSAKVIKQTFIGSDFLYELELNDKQKIFCYEPAQHNHEINQVIRIKLTLAHLTVLDS
tara:strand:- start:21 stop:1064 length:1044 start_codon:yes stop_codon:yes gene_type:complete